jgi:hypothetical protein
MGMVLLQALKQLSPAIIEVSVLGNLNRLELLGELLLQCSVTLLFLLE